MSAARVRIRPEDRVLSGAEALREWAATRMLEAPADADTSVIELLDVVAGWLSLVGGALAAHRSAVEMLDAAGDIDDVELLPEVDAILDAIGPVVES